MYAGFVSPRRTVSRLGIHQRFDMAAYRMIKPYLVPGAFPDIKDILHFEGYNGPDGLKSKTGLKPKTKDDPHPSHLYDPINDSGEVPLHITNHYAALVDCLKREDMTRASFEAAWLAHYVADGLTPAHHWPLEEKVAEAAAFVPEAVARDPKRVAGLVRKHWSLWGAKGHMSTHFNFEMGVAFALLLIPMRVSMSETELARARQLGPVGYFKAEARDIAELHLYEQFYRQGWTADLGSQVKNRLAPRTVRAIGVIWLLAILEAGQQLAIEASE